MDLSEALAQHKAAWHKRYPESARQHQAATEVLPGGNTRSVLYYDPFPLVMASGQGSHLRDVDGNDYLDFLGEFTAGVYGHSHPVIHQAITDALQGGINLTGHTLLEVQLAREIRRRLPSMEQIRFTNSGTEANLMAIALAKVHTHRSHILVFQGAYHGGLYGFAKGPSPVNVPHPTVLARYNDISSVEEAFAQHQDIAAVLVEPMQGAGGCIPAQPQFLQAVAELAREHGALLIFDEVMTSRLSPGGRQSELKIQPDLTTVGKYLGGGLSFGAFGGRANIMRRFDPREPDALPHAGTFNNNVLSMAAGYAGLSQVFTPQACIDLNARGNHLRQAVNSRFRESGLPLVFSGLGSLMNLHAMSEPPQSVADLPPHNGPVRDLFFFHMIETGHYMARRGFVVLSLPLTDTDIESFVAATDNFIERYGALLPQG